MSIVVLRVAALDASHMIGRETEAIREAAKKNGTNLAGRFAVGQSGCGMICTSISVVDVYTGKFIDVPFDDTEDGTQDRPNETYDVGIYIKPDSTLLSVDGCLLRRGDDAKHYGCGRFHSI